jgi:Putative esterase
MAFVHRLLFGLSPAWLLTVAAQLLPAAAHADPPPPWQFQVSVPQSISKEPVTGRLLLIISTRDTPEPRQAIGMNGPVVIGFDMEQLKSGSTVTVDGTAVSYPYASLRELPAGDYFAQALLIRYGQVIRADSHVLWVPTAHRRIPFTTLPGNLFSKVQPIHLDPTRSAVARFELTDVIGPLPEPKDTEYLRHVILQSKALTKFWGTPIYLRATVLLPRGYDAHPNVHYPAVYPQSHGDVPFFFDPDPASQAKDGAHSDGSNLQTGYEFYQAWISDGFPRIAAIVIEQSSPYFLEAYSVDSVNNGPYGEALIKEMIPLLEKKFRLIPKSYARATEGASTGGWEALAMQLYYPEFFGGTWVFNPDPISFKHYQQVNIYKDDSAFAVPMSPFLSAERPFRRTVEGQVTLTFRQLARLEAVLGSKGRSGYQLDIWQAVHGPLDSQGYPAPLFDKLTGKIDHTVADYMLEHGYDLTEYTRRNWATLGPKLVGKLNFFSGEMDNFYLNLGVYDFQDMLKETANPHYEGRFEFGRPKKGHNWHLTDFSQMIREVGDHMKQTAPPGEDTAQWSY